MKHRPTHRWWLALCVGALAMGAAALAEEQPPRLDVPYVPTPQAVVDKMLDMAKVTKNDIHWDLGCGDGRIVVTAAKKYGCKANGVDIDPQRIKEANANARAAGVTDRVRFMQQDLFKTDFSDVTVLTLYLLPSINMRLRPTILDLKPGTRVVSHDFSMEDWEPDEKATVEDGYGHTLFYWMVPAKVDGTWQLTLGGPNAGGPRPLTLKQKFQTFTGQVADGQQKIEIQDGKLSGTEISFSLQGLGTGTGRARFTGTVTGNRMSGKVTLEAAQGTEQRDWSATKQ